MVSPLVSSKEKERDREKERRRSSSLLTVERLFSLFLDETLLDTVFSRCAVVAASERSRWLPPLIIALRSRDIALERQDYRCK